MIDIVPNSNDIVPDFVDIVLENNGIRLCINMVKSVSSIASMEQKERSIIGCHFFYRKMS